MSQNPVKPVEPTVVELLTRIEQLEAALNKKRGTSSIREMTDDDALNVLNGSLASATHKAAAESLNLSYGQIYSCRLQYTFKHVHKALSKVDGYKNRWVKA